MKIDLYTKCVLTVIAVCLSLIVLRDVQMLEQAEASETKSNVQDVRIVGIHRHPQQRWDAMPTLQQTEFRFPGPWLK